MKIYTRRGDDGETSLANGRRVSKNSCQIEELGVLDELNASLGLLRSYLKDLPISFDITKDIQLITRSQHNCFYFGAVVAKAKNIVLTKLSANFSYQDVAALEERIDTLTVKLPAITNFILPGGNKAAAFAHQARATARRAERVLVGSGLANYDQQILKYLNRLSDYLFTLARFINKQSGQNDVIWNKEEYVTSIRRTNSTP